MSNSTMKIIPIFIPHIGCPNDCIFCNQKRITGKRSSFNLEEMKNEIEIARKTIDPNQEIEIAFFGGSFTAIERDIQEACLQIARDYKQMDSRIKGIRVSTRPDAIDTDILKLLREYGVTVIELGVQSLNDDILSKSNRGHNATCVYQSASEIRQFGFQLGLQMMVGLPGDNEEISLDTCMKIISMKPDFVRIYPVLVIRETELENQMLQGLYVPLTLAESIHIVKKLYIAFTIHRVNIIRIGLQSSENITLGRDVVGGPFHPAFKELVVSDLYRDFLEHYIVTNNLPKEVTVYSNKKLISQLTGHKKKNILYFRQKYQLILDIREENTLSTQEIKIDAHRIQTETILKILSEEYFEGGTFFASEKNRN